MRGFLIVCLLSSISILIFELLYIVCKKFKKQIYILFIKYILTFNQMLKKQTLHCNFTMNDPGVEQLKLKLRKEIVTM